MNPKYLKHLSTLPLEQRVQLIDRINEMLLDALCEQLFNEAMPEQPLPDETRNEMLIRVLAEVKGVLNG